MRKFISMLVTGSLLLLAFAVLAVSAATPQVRLMWPEPTYHQPWLVPAVDAFNARGDTELEVVWVATYSMQVFFEQVIVQIAGGMAPDIVYNNGPLLAHEGLLEDLNAFIRRDATYREGDYFQGAHSMGRLPTEPNKQFTLMLWTGPRILKLNMEAINESGLPHPMELYRKGNWTWAQFDEFGRKLLRKTGDTTSRYAVNQMDWFSPLYQSGGRIFSEDLAQVTVDSVESVEAFNWLHSHVYEKGLAPPGGVSAAFAAGQLAISEGWTDLLTQVPFAYDVAPLPQGRRAAIMEGPSGVSMLSVSTNKEAAWQVIRYLQGPEVARQMSYTLFVTPLERRTATEFLRDRSFGPPSKLEALMASLNNSVAAERFTVPFWNDVNRVLGPHIQRILKNEAPTENELRSAAGELQGLLREFHAKRK